MGRFAKKEGTVNRLQNKANNNINDDVNNNVNDNINTKDSDNDNTNKPVLEIEKKNNERKLAGFYLDKKQIKSIDGLVKKTGKDKSFIVRTAIDYFVENVEIK